MLNGLRKTGSVLATLFMGIFIVSANPACAGEPAAKKPAQETAAQQTVPVAQQPTAQPAQSGSPEQPQSAAQSEPAPAAPEKKADTKVDVYLFHGTYRCYSCNLMEELAKQAIDEQLAKEKANATVVFHHINVEEPQNSHFIQDYRLMSISIILSQKSGDKEKQWKNLDKVWVLLREPEKFKDYVITEIKNYLKG